MRNRGSRNEEALPEMEFPENWVESLVCPAIVMSTRVRIARNLEQFPFPDRLPSDGRRVLRGSIFQAVQNLDRKRWECYDLDGLPEDLDRQLQEAHKLTPLLKQRDGGAGVIVRVEDEDLARRKTVEGTFFSPWGSSILVNEEDHLRIQCLRRGLDLTEAFQRAYAMEEQLDGVVGNYAFDNTFGYLTNCPSNLGTGLRIGMMMHLVGLHLTGELPKVLQGLEKLGLEVRSYEGEGNPEAPGSIYQISNAETLGETEEEILFRMDRLMYGLAVQEDWARVRIMEQRLCIAKDLIARSVAIGSSAQLLTKDEEVALYSAAKFGLDMGLLGCPDLWEFEKANPLWNATCLNVQGNQDEIDEARATAVRQRYGTYTLL